MDKSEVAHVLTKYSTAMVSNCTFYYAPSIPIKKLINAISAFAAGIDPNSVIGLIDTTVFGSAKEGFIFTDDAMYYRETLSSPQCVSYSSVERLDFGDTESKKDNSRTLNIYMADRVVSLSTVFINKTPLMNFLLDLKSLSDGASLKSVNLTDNRKSRPSSVKPQFGNATEALCKSGKYYYPPFPPSYINYALASYAASVSPADVRFLFVPVGSSACGFILTDTQILLGSRKQISFDKLNGLEASPDGLTVVFHTESGDVEWYNDCIDTGVFCEFIAPYCKPVSNTGTPAAGGFDVKSNVTVELLDTFNGILVKEKAEEEEISRRNIFKYLRTDFRKIFPTLVVATMSSGKSTLINSLVGAELLPSQNTACTAKAVAILDNDSQDHFRIHTVSPEGEYSLVDPATPEVVADYNYNGTSQEFIIEGEISGVKNSTKAMMIFDTPGINNSLDSSHTDVTLNTLNLFSEGLILYLINAEQIGTYDDEQFLKFLVSKTKKDNNFRFIFVLNKMDAIDPDHEDPFTLLENCRNYLINNGVESPTIVSVCALGGLLIKRVLNGETLSRKAVGDFAYFYDLFEDKSYSMRNLCITNSDNSPRDVFTVGGKEYTRAQLERALDNTGIPTLEGMIDDTLVRSLELEAPEITYEK